MFCQKFLSNLQQPFGNNPWPTHPTNRNYSMHFHRQCDHLLRFQIERRISESFLLRNWLRNTSDVEDNEYETLILAYSKELDSLVLANCITKSLEEEENSPPHIEDAMMDSEEETTNTLPPFKDMSLRSWKT